MYVSTNLYDLHLSLSSISPLLSFLLSQVVFCDRSEIIVSAEARVISFVSKQGLRSEHALDTLRQSGEARGEWRRGEERRGGDEG